MKYKAKCEDCEIEIEVKSPKKFQKIKCLCGKMLILEEEGGSNEEMSSV